jgi:hypothetical protein
MMPRNQPIEWSIPNRSETTVGDAVPLNGVEDQAARRTHMREQTTARQAAERTAIRPASERHLDRLGRLDAAREREVTLQVELKRINADHLASLQDLGLSDFPESEPLIPAPVATLTPKQQPEHWREERAEAVRVQPTDLRLVVSSEIDELLLSTPNLTPAALFNYAIDELTAIASADCDVGSAGKSSKIFRLTQDRLVKLEQFAATSGMSKNDVAIAAIRQFVRNRPS